MTYRRRTSGLFVSINAEGTESATADECIVTEEEDGGPALFDADGNRLRRPSPRIKLGFEV